MNHRLLASGTLAFLATALLLQPKSLAGRQTTPSQGATLRGTVTRAGTSEPIPDVSVLVTNGRVGPRGQALPSIEEMVSTAIARGAAIPANIQAQLDAERAAARGGTSTNVQLTTKSDRDGRFIVRDLPAGQYTVQIEREGFFGLPLAGTNNYPVFVGTNVNVAAGQAAPDLTLSLVPGSAISGRVVDPDGQPVVGSNVQALRLAYQNGAPTLQAMAEANTDDRGDYRLYRIPPGEYYFGVTPGQSGGRGIDAFLGGGFGGRAGRGAIPTSGNALVRTFHPNAIDANGATLLALRGGEELSGIGITARRSPTIKVSGQVSSAIALPVQTAARGQTRTVPVQLILVPRDKNAPQDSTIRNTVSVSMDSPVDGKFEIPGVIPGSYDLYARVNNPLTDAAAITSGTVPLAYFGRIPFDAGSQDLQGISVLVRSGVELKTYVTVDGSATGAANNVRVLLQPADSSRLVTGYQGRGAQPVPGPDGVVTIPFVNEGLYRLQVNIIPVAMPARGQRGATTGTTLRDAYVEDIREGGLSVFDNGLLVGKEAPRPIEIVVKTNGGTITGTVYDARQQQKAGATVVLVPSEYRRQNLALYKTGISGDKGQFGMIGIAPGQYKLFAWENIPTGAHQNPAFISKYEARGQSINVNASSTTAAQVTVIPQDR